MEHEHWDVDGGETGWLSPLPLTSQHICPGLLVTGSIEGQRWSDGVGRRDEVDGLNRLMQGP